MLNSILTTQDLIAILQEVESQYGVCSLVLNKENLIEHITVIENTKGNLLSFSGDIYKCHPNIALGKNFNTEEFYNLKRLQHNNVNK